VLHRNLSDYDVRRFNVPLVGHIALFRYGRDAEEFGRLKVKLATLGIE
jgi:hypothetical protein